MCLPVHIRLVGCFRLGVDAPEERRGRLIGGVFGHEFAVNGEVEYLLP